MSDAHAHHDHRPLYIKIFVWLFVLTAIEVGIVYVPMGQGLMISALCGLALVKAALVAIHYMHLSSETKWLRWTIYSVMFIPVFYALVLIAEGWWRLLRNAGVV
ncbi:MAG: cytochrome C oxidase subunit IV family protein [Myxococcota bacterium]|jgi:caa(3)-type oxidase subunit IV|nr:cytochrome C oxidase subunit IV family protein [Myxococcota bacterium]